MNRVRLPKAALLLLAVPLLALVQLVPSSTDAQTRRAIRGNISGVELTLEGGTTVTRGETLRFWTTSYEVVGLRTLRPAAGARLSLVTALDRQEAATFEADRGGGALIELAVPIDAPDSFGVTLRVNVGSGVARRFDFSVRTLEPRSLELVAAPAAFAGRSVPVAGTLRQGREALSGAEVTLEVSDSRGPLLAPIRTRTDARGAFSHRFAIPRDAQGSLRVLAKSEADGADRRVQASAQVALLQRSTAGLQLHASPESAIIEPGQSAPFRLVLRRRDGRPVGGAVVTFSRRSLVERDAIPARYADEYAITDGRGEARLRLPVEDTRRMRGEFRDHTVSFHARAPGLGSASATTSVRVSAHSHATTLRIEGSSLSAGIDARVTAIVAGINGEPAEGRSVVLEGPAIGRHEGQSDASGVVAFDVQVPIGARDEQCGGTAATSATLTSPGSVRRQLCLPINVDATTRPRISGDGGEELQVSIARRADVRRAPVLVTLHRADAQRAPIAAVITRGDTATLPYLQRERVLVRTRALDDQRPLAGTYVAYEPVSELAPPAIEAAGSDDSIRVSVVQPEEATTVWMALPPSALSAFNVGARRSMPRRGFERALRIGSVPRDDAAPFARRSGRVVPLPEPAAGAMLRDPWRARERFVEGRLALVFRAIEARYDQSGPGDMDAVLSIEGGRFQLREELMATLDSGSLGAEGATGLGGEPLTISRLKELDSRFDVHSVARRVTRRRLFGLLLALRDFVRERGFDLPWARPGDPSLWLEPLQGRYVQGFGSVDARALADGWGRPFALRRVSRARYSAVQPVAGFELVSAGRDGRFGTGDDVRDPTARVLAEGSLYADAVGETALVARLSGVELGRASAMTLAESFGMGIAPIPFARGGGDHLTLNQPGLPPALPDHRFELSLERPLEPFDVPSATSTGTGEQSEVLRVGEEPRTWRVIALTTTGRRGFERLDAGTRAGSSILLTGNFPQRLTTGEALERRFHITNVGSRTASYAFAGSGEGVALRVPPTLEVPPGESRSFDVTFVASQRGRLRPSLEVRSESATRTLTGRIASAQGLHPIRRAATGIAPFATRLRVDEDGAQTRAIVLAGNALAFDPDLRDATEAAPALTAYSHALSGRELTPELRAKLLRTEPGGALTIAPAVVALSTLVAPDGGVDQEAAAMRRRLVGRLNGVGTMPDRDPSAGQLRATAISLAALATAGAPSQLDRFSSGRSASPLDGILIAWRRQLRTALRDQPAEATLLARAAAALLLVDPRDGHGRAMYERALSAINAETMLLTPTEDRPGLVETTSGTLALALAAHQLGDTDRARALLRGASRYQRSMTRRANESTFWWLSAGAYGVFGDTPETVELEVNGTAQEVALEGGAGVIELPASVRVRHAGDEGLVLVRVESVFGRPFEAVDGPLLGLALRGEVGQVNGLAGYELEVRAKQTVSEPVIDLQLPAGVDISDAVLAALGARSGIVEATLRRPGFVRLRLSPMSAEQTLAIALPLPWSSPSTVRGLGAVAYSSSAVDAMTVLAPVEASPQTR
ncbi:MAG: hypothetical protein AAF645_02230 [Myxococcota bacterium]